VSYHFFLDTFPPFRLLAWKVLGGKGFSSYIDPYCLTVFLRLVSIYREAYCPWMDHLQLQVTHTMAGGGTGYSMDCACAAWLDIWRTSVDGIIMGCCSIILRKVVHTPPPFLCAPYGTQLPTAHGLPELVPNGLQLAICGVQPQECHLVS